MQAIVNTANHPIYIGLNILNKLPEIIPTTSKLMIITDETVAGYYLSELMQILNSFGFKVLHFAFPSGESSKNIATKTAIEEFMFVNGCDRGSIILAFGGGVVGDLAGFIAATYMRGIAYIQIPTTLTAMVDSSVGGKTGIDTPYGKNLIGAFWQPKAVITDIKYLKTLPHSHLINGSIEAIKMFLTSDVGCLNYLQANIKSFLNFEENTLIYLIEHAVKIKSEVVAQDERESGLRVILNFGHTIGHAIEKLANYELLHGYAVGLGILVEAKIAELCGHLSRKQYFYIKDLMQPLGIRSEDLRAFDAEQIIECTRIDKKNKSGKVYYVLINGLGSIYHEGNQFAHAVEDDIVRRAYGWK